MKRNCSEYWERIVQLAEGTDDADARAHLESCEECRTKFGQLQEILAVRGARFFDAPSRLVADVKAAIPRRERRVATLLQSTLAWSGARAITEDFQVVVGQAENRTRLMYSRSEDRWEVLGRMPSSNWVALRDGQRLSSGDGTFSFQAATLSDTDVTLIGPEGEVYVPSAEELLRGSDHRH